MKLSDSRSGRLNNTPKVTACLKGFFFYALRYALRRSLTLGVCQSDVLKMLEKKFIMPFKQALLGDTGLIEAADLGFSV